MKKIQNSTFNIRMCIHILLTLFFNLAISSSQLTWKLFKVYHVIKLRERKLIIWKKKLYWLEFSALITSMILFKWYAALLQKCMCTSKGSTCTLYNIKPLFYRQSKLRQWNNILHHCGRASHINDLVHIVNGLIKRCVLSFILCYIEFEEIFGSLLYKWMLDACI